MPHPLVQRPILGDQQVWRRNQYHRNWGALRPFRFRQGSPQLIVASYYPLAAIILLQLYSLFHLIRSSKSYTEFQTFMAFLVNVVLLASIVLFQRDPGLRSSSYPVLDELQLGNFKGYCPGCKIHMEEEPEVQHCKQCQVCIKGIYYHSQILGVCITSTNVGYFLLLNGAALAFSALMLYL